MRFLKSSEFDRICIGFVEREIDEFNVGKNFKIRE